MTFTLMQNRATVIAMDVSRQGKRRSFNRVTLRVGTLHLVEFPCI